jgi:hypothetical protein
MLSVRFPVQCSGKAPRLAAGVLVRPAARVVE